MIIIGFPGIGKSTVSKSSDKYVDLESSCFDKAANKLWYKDYCKTAIDLSNQGYVVFVSSHDKVREYFRANKVERVYAIFPHTSLKDEWIKRLSNRYNDTGKAKDDRALTYIIDNYESATKAMFDESQYSAKYNPKDSYRFISRVIEDINYDIKDVVNSLVIEDIKRNLPDIKSQSFDEILNKKVSVGVFDITIK